MLDYKEVEIYSDSDSDSDSDWCCKDQSNWVNKFTAGGDKWDHKLWRANFVIGPGLCYVEVS